MFNNSLNVSPVPSFDTKTDGTSVYQNGRHLGGFDISIPSDLSTNIVYQVMDGIPVYITNTDRQENLSLEITRDEDNIAHQHLIEWCTLSNPSTLKMDISDDSSDGEQTINYTINVPEGVDVDKPIDEMKSLYYHNDDTNND